MRPAAEMPLDAAVPAPRRPRHPYRRSEADAALRAEGAPQVRARAEAMLQAGRPDAAERLAAAAMRTFPRNVLLHAMHAQIAGLRGDLTEAASRWILVAQRFPDYAPAQEQAERAGKQAEADPAEQPETARNLLMQFESVGCNCDFGLLQRGFGAEPLGLLRFSRTRPQTLLKLLRTRFDGIGDPGRMQLVVVGKEYRLIDPVSDLRTHTGIRATAAEAAAVKAAQCRHVGFLRAKLLRDLEKQTKLFIYQQPGLTDDQIRDLHAGFASYGPNRLLCLRRGGDPGTAATMQAWGEGLLVVELGAAALPDGANGWHLPVATWLYVCRQALAFWRPD